MDNVVQMPTQAERIADQIRSHIAGMERAEGDWRDHAIALCEQVAAAKALYQRTKNFGSWWDAQNFGMNANTRAALVAMGQDLEQTRKVMAVTERRSIERIYRNEFRVGHVPKLQSDVPKSPPENQDEQVGHVPKLHPKEKITISKPRKADIIAEQLIREYDELGVPLPMSGPEVKTRCPGTKTSVSSDVIYTIKKEMLAREVKSEPVVSEPIVDPATFPKSWAEKFEIAKRQLEKQLRIEFEARVEEKAAELLEVTLQHYAKKVEFADNFKKTYNPRMFPFTADEFKKIITCVHPDRVQDDALKARYTTAFNLLNEKKMQLVMPDPPQGLSATTFPRTSADILARRKK